MRQPLVSKLTSALKTARLGNYKNIMYKIEYNQNDL